MERKLRQIFKILTGHGGREHEWLTETNVVLDCDIRVLCQFQWGLL